MSYPWSPGAQSVYTKSRGRRPAGGWGLIIEHLYPRELLVGDLLAGDDLDPSATVELLSGRVMAAVVTRDEDRLLPPRGRSPEAWANYDADPWARYRSAAFAVGGFAPVGASAQDTEVAIPHSVLSPP